MLTALEIMRLRDDEDQLLKERTMLERQVRHMVRLVDDLLDVSRITRGKIELKRARHELGAIVTKAIEIASPLFEQRRHHLHVDLALDGIQVEGDSVRLAQVFANLLTNAAKYTEPGGIIEVLGHHNGELAEVTVCDNGIGIAPEVLPHVFDLFMQAPQALDRAQGGLGVGLHLVQRLTALHGGTVRVESALGEGSCFTVSLPIALGSVAAVDVPSLDEVATPMALGKRVLIVDDNEDAAEMLSMVLRQAGYETEVVFDGPSALRQARTYGPDVVVLDIGLPVMDGYEVARQLRAMPVVGSARIVALTGYGQASDVARSMAAGIDAHLVKPVDVDRLRAAIEGVSPEERPAA
jgi:CheY-like chemotaxis protein